jgi:hypothetical protein
MVLYTAGLLVAFGLGVLVGFLLFASARREDK